MPGRGLAADGLSRPRQPIGYSCDQCSSFTTE